MKAKYLHLSTPYGTRYSCNLKTGNVTRYGEHRWPDDHMSWRIAGLEKIGPFGRLTFVPLSVVAKRLSADEFGPATFKNGSPMYTVRDIDHGATRIWGNSKHHGINAIWVEDTP